MTIQQALFKAKATRGDKQSTIQITVDECLTVLLLKIRIIDITMQKKLRHIYSNFLFTTFPFKMPLKVNFLKSFEITTITFKVFNF